MSDINVIGKYLVDENNNGKSPIASSHTVFMANGKTLQQSLMEIDYILARWTGNGSYVPQLTSLITNPITVSGEYLKLGSQVISPITSLKTIYADSGNTAESDINELLAGLAAITTLT